MTFSQRIKLGTDDGQLIVDFLVDVMQDRYEDFRICHRLEAAKLLTTYGNEDAPDFIDDNPQPKKARRNRSKASRQTKFDTELARVIREDTRDGRYIARFLIDVMTGDLRRFKPHHRMAAARELLDRGFGKSARAEKVARPQIESGAGSEPVKGPKPVPTVRPEPVKGPKPVPTVRPEPVEGPKPVSTVRPEPVEGPYTSTGNTNEITLIPESQKSEFRQPNPPTNQTNEITAIPESHESEFRQPAEEKPLTPQKNIPRTDTDYWPDSCDSPLHDLMSECEHPDFDPCLATVDEEYFQSFTDCTDPECVVHGEDSEVDFDPNNYHY